MCNNMCLQIIKCLNVRSNLMKKMKFSIMIILAALSTQAFSVEMMSHNDFKKVESHYKLMGTVSVSGAHSTAEAKKSLMEKAEKRKADILVLASGNTNNKVHVTAKIYKKQ